MNPNSLNFPTRGSNILDLFFTNRPSLVSRCEVREGVSDRGAVSVEAEVAVERRRPIIPHTVFPWKRCDTDRLRASTKEFVVTLIAPSGTPPVVEELWVKLRDGILSILESEVPSKMTSCRYSQPWVTRQILVA